MLNLLLILQWLGCLFHLALAIWPQPNTIATGADVLWYSPNISLHIIDYRQCYVYDSTQHPLSGSTSCEGALGGFPTEDRDLIELAFSHLQHDITDSSFIPWKFHLPGSDFEPDLRNRHEYLHSIRVEIFPDAISASNSPEAYKIDGLSNGIITISAPTVSGVRHAFTTLSQLFYKHSHGDEIYSPCFPVSIVDYPRFEHRGLNLDIARNEILPEDVYRTIDIMRLTKLNKLHLHATDSQSWPLDIPALPELSRKGAYRASHTWSSETLNEIQAFAQSQGIELYLEIDMPGHTASIHHSQPDLIAGYNAPLLNYSASEPPSGQLRLNSTSVQTFLNTLLTDILPRIKPYTTHFHLGGDELNTNIYALDPTVNSTSRNKLLPLLQSFYNTILSHLSHHNLTPIFWQEALLDWNLTLPSNSIIQTWRPEPKDLTTILSRGHRALFGAASHWYLDCGFGTYLDSITSLQQDWCAPYKSWRHVYAYHPLESLSDEIHELIVGGEVHLWSELTDSFNLDGKLWPRAAAAAEVLWKGPVGVGGVSEGVTRRLAEWRERVVRRGVGAEVVQMTWCLMNEGGCVV